MASQAGRVRLSILCRVLPLALLLACTLCAADTNHFRCNQVGFYPAGNKLCIVVDITGISAGTQFKVVKQSDNSAAFTGQPSLVVLVLESDVQRVSG